MRLSSQKTRGPVKLELSMTSMIDVVFLLLIFFMVTTSVVMSERQNRATLKVDSESQGESLRIPVVVEFVYSDGRYKYKLDENAPYATAEQLEDKLRQFPVDSKFDGAFVRVDDNVPFDMASSAIEACRAAGFLSVSYLPVEDDAGSQ